MSWFLAAIIAYLTLAIVNLLDKFLVTSILRDSKSYAFIACVLGSLVFVAAPWFVFWPGWPLLFLNLLNGAIFALALWFLYEALLRGEASRILVLVGGMTPLFSLVFSVLFLKEQFTNNQWLGMSLILVGVFVIALLPVSRSYLARVFHKLKLFQEFKPGGLRIALLSSLAYSLYFMSTKQAYLFQPFASAFIWTRLGAALFVLLFLIDKNSRQTIIRTFHRSSPGKHKFLVIVNQGFGSLGFVLQNYAIFLGSVVLVNALQGIQYAFLLIISALLAVMAPKLLKETFSWRILVQKIAAVAVIAVGLYFIAI
ncbi:MAG: DMT family transporter [Patescibacteria group bacterium]|jgi:drug/metabolite transporter (DMT)-like permease